MADKTALMVFDRLLESVHLKKDVGMIPVFLNRVFGMDCAIAAYGGAGVKGQGVKIHSLKQTPASVLPYIRNYFNPIAGFIRKNAKNTGLLIVMHLRRSSFFFASIFKAANPAGKAWLKLDMDMILLDKIKKMRDAEKSAAQSKNPLDYISCMLKIAELGRLRRGFKNFDMVSAETAEACAALEECLNTGNIVYLPNGFDAGDKDVPDALPFEKKENIIMTAGRVGSRQKNTGMLLEAATKTDMKDWKIYIAGGVEENFKPVLDGFFRSHPGLKGKIIITGNIEKNADLYGLYNRSKVFCLTSEWEGFPLVFTEALYFGNYIISTDVGSQKEVTNNGKTGRTINRGDIAALSAELQAVIEGKNDISLCFEDVKRTARERYLWEKIIKDAHAYLCKTGKVA